MYQYNESGILKDGTKVLQHITRMRVKQIGWQVNFLCSESKVSLRSLGHIDYCTVVYMMPMDEQNKVMNPVQMFGLERWTSDPDCPGQTSQSDFSCHSDRMHTADLSRFTVVDSPRARIDSNARLCLAAEAGDVLKSVLLNSELRLMTTAEQITFRRFHNTHRVVEYIENDGSVPQGLGECLTSELHRQLQEVWPEVLAALGGQRVTTIILAMRIDDSVRSGRPEQEEEDPVLLVV